MVEIRRISFEDVLPVWKHKLWPNRLTPIQPVSTIQYLGGYDMEIKQSKPSFWGAFESENLIGVLSGFKTSAEKYRCRGLLVEPEFRKRGVAQALFSACQQQAQIENSQFLWSLPRKTAIHSYLLFDFKQTSDWHCEGMEFGPNCYVLKNIADQ